MNKFSLIVAFLLLSIASAFSQKIITGQITDNEDEKLFGATVVLLQAKDSSIATYGMTNEAGLFKLRGMAKGTYKLKIQFVGFEPKTIDITKQKESIDLGKIRLEVSKLAEIVVEGEAIPITLKKDTVEFNSKAFKTQPNAKVEELLKKLPGVQVDKDGTVKSQGKTVEKILVDGKEFFGGDLKMATQNLPSDIVEKVQVYDKSSEMSEFTGVDDGEKRKTINLVLKENKKKGIFGDVTVGGGTNEFYKAKANLSSFKKQNQLSVIGNINNLNQSGGGDYEGEDLSSLAMPSALGMNTGSSGGTGTLGSLGVNFNREIGEKTKLESSYSFSGSANKRESSLKKTTYTSMGSFPSTQKSNNKSEGFGHNANVKLEHRINKNQDIVFRGEGSYNPSETSGNSDIQNVLENVKTSVNRTNTGKNDSKSLNASLLYRKKFAKKGRFITARVANNYSSGENLNNQKNQVSKLIDELKTDSLGIQNQETINKNQEVEGKISYTEPLGKFHRLQLSYQKSYSDNRNTKDFEDLVNGKKVKNQLLSSDYRRFLDKNNATLTYNLNKDKINFNSGLTYQISTLKGDLISINKSFKNQYQQFLPFFRFRYSFSKMVNLNFDYNSSLNIPSVRQLQPVRDNSNPLYLYEGNPNLKPEKHHSVQLGFNFFDMSSFLVIFNNSDFSITKDKIITAIKTDPKTLVQLSSPLNINDGLRLSNTTFLGRDFNSLNLRFGIMETVSWNKGYNILDRVITNAYNLDNNISMSLGNAKKKKLDWEINAGHNVGKNNNGTTSSGSYNNINISAITTFYLPAQFYFTAKYNHSIFQNTSSITNDQNQPAQQVQLLEVSVNKRILKNRGEFKFSGFDLLNQNTSIRRSVSQNAIQQEQTNAIGRYFMLSFTYQLSSFRGNNDFSNYGDEF